MKVAATVDQFAPRVFPSLRAAVDGLPPATPDLAQLDGAADLIETWIAAGAPLLADGSGNIPYPGVTIYRAWRTQVQKDTFDDELGSNNRLPDFTIARVGDNQDYGGEFSTLDALFLRALDFPSAAFPTSRDYFRNVSNGTNPGRDATLVEALRTALTTLTAQYGSTDPTQWLTPKITVEFDATSAAPLLYGDTIIERENRGTMNHVVELLPTPAAQIIVPPGNSAFIPATLFPEPPHLRDQVAPYEAFQYHRNPFTPEKLEEPTTSQTITLP